MDDRVGVSGRSRPRWWLSLGVIGALIGLVTIAALVLTLRSATRERDAALGWQQHSYEVMILGRTLDAAVGQSEAALGRFVLSGDKNIGRVYFDDWRRAGLLIDRLDREVSEGRSQALIDQLRGAYAARGDELAAVALRTNYGQNPEALGRYYEAGKSATLRRISTLIDGVIATERALLNERSLAAQATIQRSNRIGAILSALGLALVIALGFVGYSAIQSWSRRLTEEVRNDELEAAVASRTAELRDVNELLLTEMATREATEARLRQAQKMEAIGQLTGGIAHDFNNMLAVVISGIELAQRRMGIANAVVTRNLESALEGAQRAAALTKRLLAFSRAEPLLPVAVDPNELLADMYDLLQRAIGDTIAVRVLPFPGAWPVFVDPQQFENTILNLAVNGRDAMVHGGTLTIAVSNLLLGEGEVEGAGAGEHVRIAVTDTGSGMARSVLDRVFEPFFTTKPVGQGTGLGLSQIFGFVRQSAGAVSVDSAPDMGTTVSIYLPRSSAPSATVQRGEAPRTAQTAARRSARVLVVEDDARVLAATVDALMELGHNPVPCPNPADAAGLLAGHGDIALLITDVLMPGMTGPELVASLRTRHPELPVLFVTGFAGDIEDAAAFGGHAVLRKPFTIAALSHVVEGLLSPPPEKNRAAA